MKTKIITILNLILEYIRLIITTIYKAIKPKNIIIIDIELITPLLELNEKSNKINIISKDLSKHLIITILKNIAKENTIFWIATSIEYKFLMKRNLMIDINNFIIIDNRTDLNHKTNTIEQFIQNNPKRNNYLLVENSININKITQIKPNKIISEHDIVLIRNWINEKT